ncbi:hypothetical protein GOODEAATRI_003536 [Goodea atripinnis]|uniref:ATP synthase F0 subunit 6 n=1 Tax=Goodea atripinnis TaxID=208336 RepID=A0ABV0NRL0_9TELE
MEVETKGIVHNFFYIGLYKNQGTVFLIFTWYLFLLSETPFFSVLKPNSFLSLSDLFSLLLVRYLGCLAAVQFNLGLAATFLISSSPPPVISAFVLFVFFLPKLVLSWIVLLQLPPSAVFLLFIWKQLLFQCVKRHYE